jgi:hypothetical protein
MENAEGSEPRNATRLQMPKCCLSLSQYWSYASPNHFNSGWKDIRKWSLLPVCPCPIDTSSKQGKNHGYHQAKICRRLYLQGHGSRLASTAFPVVRDIVRPSCDFEHGAIEGACIVVVHEQEIRRATPVSYTGISTLSPAGQDLDTHKYTIQPAIPNFPSHSNRSSAPARPCSGSADSAPQY